jgi:hypothetical protein
MLTALFRDFGGPPGFRIYGKAKAEKLWREIDVFVTTRRNCASGWPILRGSCITWTSQVIVVGCDFAQALFREQAEVPATPVRPVEVQSGRLNRGRNPAAICVRPCSEVLAHECGHTYQALRLGPFYLPAGALFTWWREGPHWWNQFENRASERGLFGGVVPGSLRIELES